MDRHNQTHNDIKPQNFLIKFKNGPNDLTQIRIALTDFGMAGPESQGGTPVFASPECFEKKEKKSDIFSFGRVILFLLLSKQQFMKWLYVPIKDLTRMSSCRILMNSRPNQRLYLVSQMMSIANRITLQSARSHFNRFRRDSRIKLTDTLIGAIETIVNDEISNDFGFYVSELCDFRLSDFSHSNPYWKIMKIHLDLFRNLSFPGHETNRITG